MHTCPHLAFTWVLSIWTQFLRLVQPPPQSQLLFMHLKPSFNPPLNPLFLIPALLSLFLCHISLFLVPQAHKAPFYLCAFTCKAFPAPHPLPAKLLQIFVQISPVWRGLLLDISRSYSLSPMITGLINTATISYLLGWLPDYCFSLPEVSKLYAGRQTVSTLCSLYSQLMGKKNLLTNGTVTVCQMTELQTVMLW